MVWDGKIERRADPNDHDRLVRLLVSVENHVINFDKHVADDKVSFKSIQDQVGKHAIWIYIGLGIVGTVEVFLKH